MTIGRLQLTVIATTAALSAAVLYSATSSVFDEIASGEEPRAEFLDRGALAAAPSEPVSADSTPRVEVTSADDQRYYEPSALERLRASAAARAVAPVPSSFELERRTEFVLPDGSALPVTDRREWAAETSERARKLDQDAESEARRAFAEATVDRMRGNGFAVEEEPELNELRVIAGLAPQAAPGLPVDPPIPGGVGYGILYSTNALLWEDETLLVHRLIVPRTAGGDVTAYLYNTATNRSNQGVEAFISYPGPFDARFRIYDWAKTGTARWALTLYWEAFQQYRINTQSDDGTWRQEIEVWNETRKVSGDNVWANRVHLLNQKTGALDLVYEYVYETSDPTKNTYQGGDRVGFWGPIFETFQNHDGSNKPIGANQSMLRQDGTWQSFDSRNSNFHIEDRDLDPPVFRTGNSAWAVGSAAGELPQSAVEAEDVARYRGEATANGWQVSPPDGTGWMLWGHGSPFGATAAGGGYVFQLDAKVDSLAGPAGDPIAIYGLYDRAAPAYFEYRYLYRSDFSSAGRFEPLRFEFSATGSERLDPFVYYLGGVGLEVDVFSIAQN